MITPMEKALPTDPLITTDIRSYDSDNPCELGYSENAYMASAWCEGDQVVYEEMIAGYSVPSNVASCCWEPPPHRRGKRVRSSGWYPGRFTPAQAGKTRSPDFGSGSGGIRPHTSGEKLDDQQIHPPGRRTLLTILDRSRFVKKVPPHKN